MNCRTCKHWGATPEQRGGIDWQECLKMKEPAADERMEPANLAWAESDNPRLSRAYLMTKPDFGCVMFERLVQRPAFCVSMRYDVPGDALTVYWHTKEPGDICQHTPNGSVIRHNFAGLLIGCTIARPRHLLFAHGRVSLVWVPEKTEANHTLVYASPDVLLMIDKTDEIFGVAVFNADKLGVPPL